jgi:hypothetical protein
MNLPVVRIWTAGQEGRHRMRIETRRRIMAFALAIALFPWGIANSQTLDGGRPADGFPVSTECVPSRPCVNALDAGCDQTSYHHALIDAIFGDKPLLNSLRSRDVGIADLRASVGGELRYRYMDERNRLRPQGNLRRNTYDLWRFTPVAEIGNDRVRAYVQAIDAVSFGEDLPPVPIDENRSDLLQYYLDLGLIDVDGKPVRVRYGRQFLKYGSQHLVSPLGWANTFRNFEGTRAYWENEAWAIDGFAVQPVNGAGGAVPHPFSRDIPDQSVWFSGVYAAYKKAPYGNFDLYWMWLNEDEPKFSRHDGRRHTVGMRYAGKYAFHDCGTPAHTLFWDAEAALQFGEDSFQSGGAGQDVFAGFVAAEAGLTLNRIPWQPTVKGLFWYGSGDGNPTDGKINTLTTLFPFGHYYWGLIDNFNGANLFDYSVQFSVKPTKKLTLTAAWHWFDKADANDFVYNIVGAPLGTLGGDRTIGHELDLVANYAVSPNLSFQLGYFWFWYGDAINNGPLSRSDAEQFYFQTTWGF